MAPTTEIAILPLKPGTELGDPDHAAARVFKDCATTISQAAGYQEMSFGTWEESPDRLQMMINWNSYENHKDFIASEPYAAFLKSFGTIMSGGPQIKHVDFGPTPGRLRAVLSAPVTEIATFYFNGSAPSDYVERVEKFASLARDSSSSAFAEGFIECAAGVTHEQDLQEIEGVKGAAAVVAIGWQSVQAHLDYRETQGFKDNIHLLRDGRAGAEAHHVAMMNFVA